ncbi:hypothetical protein [Butyrivibrio sp. JL13D10]|uniref:hypothetical protein n=1 Tax=Butyrivibrio sp. JL13D10 TaxID=3236815 RepID=UPI0038B5B9AF
MREKIFSVRKEIVLIAVLPAFVITIAMLITGIMFMRSGMGTGGIKRTSGFRLYL